MTALFDELERTLGAAAVLRGAEALEKAYSPWARLGAPTAMLRPKTTEELSQALKLCHAAAQPVTPWGGLTGLVDGAYANDMVALSLERMNQVEHVDPVNGVMQVEAGCTLQAACEAAEAKGRFLPLDIGARGSATIGGNLATNAGGNRVLRWGMARESVLGLEVVLADGTVVSSLNTLIKNNAGYDLKQLFIGSEGTLGVITRAVLRLRALPTSQCTALLAVDRFKDISKVLARVSRDLGGALSAFEVMWEDCYRLLTTPPAQGRPITPYGHAFHVLVEAMGSDQAGDDARFESVLGEGLEAGEIADAAIAKSQAERDAMWAIRDDVGQTARNGPILAFDVSLKISDMEAYVDDVRGALAAQFGPGASLMVFGHLGDGNLHLIVGVGSRAPDIRHRVEMLVYTPLASLGGSISAEHGIGLQKRDYLHLSRSAPEIALMQRLKRALDPTNILNPGKVFAAA